MTLRLQLFASTHIGPWGEDSFHTGLVVTATPRVPGAPQHFTAARGEDKHQCSISKPHEGREYKELAPKGFSSH